MRRRWRRTVSIVVRLIVAWLALLALRIGLEGLPAEPSLWLRAPAAFAVIKLAGDLTLLALFRDQVVFFAEDLFWELLVFTALGVLAAGLITLAATVIGGAVEPYFPAWAVYFVYLVAETRQHSRVDRE